MTDTPAENLAEVQEKIVASQQVTQSPGIEQLLTQAQQAEMMGIPVDWKAMSMKVFNAANKTIQSLNKRIEELNPVAPPEEDPAGE